MTNESTSSAVKRLYYKPSEGAQAGSLPVFPTYSLYINVSNFELKDFGRDNTQGSRQVATGTPDGGSMLSFDSPDCSFDEMLSEHTLIHISNGEKPGIVCKEILDARGAVGWRIDISTTAEHFHDIERHIMGTNPLTGEKVHSSSVSEGIAVGGSRCTLLDPDKPASLDFEAELICLKIGDRQVFDNQ